MKVQDRAGVFLVPLHPKKNYAKCLLVAMVMDNRLLGEMVSGIWNDSMFWFYLSLQTVVHLVASGCQ